MDPNANLKEQLEIAGRIVGLSRAGAALIDSSHDAERLAELVLALDEWLDKGGALPEMWNSARQKNPRS